jgi:molybdopterin-binding protein
MARPVKLGAVSAAAAVNVAPGIDIVSVIITTSVVQLKLRAGMKHMR